MSRRRRPYPRGVADFYNALPVRHGIELQTFDVAAVAERHEGSAVGDAAATWLRQYSAARQAGLDDHGARSVAAAAWERVPSPKLGVPVVWV